MSKLAIMGKLMEVAQKGPMALAPILGETMPNMVRAATAQRYAAIGAMQVGTVNEGIGRAVAGAIAGQGDLPEAHVRQVAAVLESAIASLRLAHAALLGPADVAELIQAYAPQRPALPPGAVS